MATTRQHLADFGSPAAYVSAGSLAVLFACQQFGNAIVAAAPRLTVALAIVTVLGMWAWIGGFAVVARDLGQLTSRATGARWMMVARWATRVALVTPILIIASLLTSVGVPIQSPTYLLMFLGVGTSLLVYNLAARRAGLLHRVVPWLGVAAGIAYVIAGIGFGAIFLPGAGFALYVVGLYVLFVGEVLYIAWAIWMGVMLGRSKIAIPATGTPAVAQ